MLPCVCIKTIVKKHLFRLEYPVPTVLLTDPAKQGAPLQATLSIK